jgi:hypothetical protein
MKAKINGYYLSWHPNDHNGDHIHIVRDGKREGVWERGARQAIRGLEMNRKVAEAIAQFEHEIDKRQQQEQ